MDAADGWNVSGLTGDSLQQPLHEDSGIENPILDRAD